MRERIHTSMVWLWVGLLIVTTAACPYWYLRASLAALAIIHGRTLQMMLDRHERDAPHA
jgi:hypothetical protein